MWKINEVQEAIQPKVLSQSVNKFDAISTDTREDLTDKLFVALRGESFDAHNFLESAIENGAKGVVIDEWREEWEPHLKQVSFFKVSDTLQALQDLAHYWRKKNKFKVMAITGSNGKTTTKEFAATLIQGTCEVAYSKGSFNNHWGVPLSLLTSDSSAQVVVLEMGMNHRGEIKRLCEIAQPDVVLVTTVGFSHVGELGSIENVEKAKEEIYENSPGAVAIFNGTNEYTMAMYKREMESKRHKRCLVFSAFGDNPADVRMKVDQVTVDGLVVKGSIAGVSGEAHVPIFGRQNLYNIMAACSLALTAGVDASLIWQRLPNLRTIWGRNQLVKLKSGANVIFDAYNANPESVTALVKNLYEMSVEGKKVAVLGEMLELGQHSEGFHRDIGQLVGKSAFDYVWFVGASGGLFKEGLQDAGFEKNFDISDSYKETLAIQLRNMLNEGDIVIIKGSRGVKLEQVLECLEPEDMPQKN